MTDEHPDALITAAWRTRIAELEVAIGLITDTCALAMKHLREGAKSAKDGPTRAQLLSAIGTLVVTTYQLSEVLGLGHLPEKFATDPQAFELRAAAAAVRELWAKRVRERQA